MSYCADGRGCGDLCDCEPGHCGCADLAECEECGERDDVSWEQHEGAALCQRCASYAEARRYEGDDGRP